PHYIPAKKFVDLLASSGHFQIETLRRINGAVAFTTLGKVETKDIFSGCEAAFMFVMPADLSQEKQFTRSFLKAADEAGIRRLAWVAPACPEVSELGKNLAEAEALVRSQGVETLVLRHAPLFSYLLDHKKKF
ncbi:MAG: hypothetical protein PUP93_13965, partial [Rhizonema sp. NSF051]|nr:hypothetical protein [Rhizonema sp. NSF051]